jgi:hypothetical protein
VLGKSVKEIQTETLNINSEEGAANLEDLGPEDYNAHSKLFNSDSESSSVNSEGSNSNTVNPKQKSDKLDYANYTKLFEKRPSTESLSSRSSTSFILEDYNSFKKKLSMKKSLHK